MNILRTASLGSNFIGLYKKMSVGSYVFLAQFIHPKIKGVFIPNIFDKYKQVSRKL